LRCPVLGRTNLGAAEARGLEFILEEGGRIGVRRRTHLLLVHGERGIGTAIGERIRLVSFSL
jgi:hypothetical protein